MKNSFFENKVFTNYEKLGFVCIGVKLGYNEETGNKILEPPTGWTKMTKTTYEEKHNGVMIRNKTQLKDGSYLYIVDCDNKLDEEGKTGNEYFRSYCQEAKASFKTIVQTTGRGGYHYFFRTFNEELIKQPQIIGLTIDGIERQIDICNGLISTPSQYGNDKIIKKYEFFHGNVPNDISEIAILPDVISDLILRHDKNSKKKIVKEKDDDETDYNLPLNIVNPNYPLLNILSSHFESYSNWSRMCWIMKSLNYPFSVFDEYSRKYPSKYNVNECLKYWNNCKVSPKMTEGILHSLARKGNPEEYDKLGLTNKSKPDVIPVDTLEITNKQLIKNDGYLIHKDNINLDYDDCLISNKLKEFFSSDIKSFNIKSPYDTGKTQLLKKIMTKYQQKRVLFLSYRKTLTSDLMACFGELGFHDYRNTECHQADKLIIQLESINKIKPSDFMFIDDEYEIPKYDLVIMDEIESLLFHFESQTTFKGESKNIFEFIEAIIKNSNKLIGLDGDLSFRGFNYIKSFGDSINIINPVKKNKRHFTIIDSENDFYSQINNSLNFNKKIVIVSQTSTQCYTVFNYIIKQHPTLKIGIYTGDSSDSTKNDLDKVLENWVKLDVLIYSPTIEAGVNFDIKHFDRIFGIVSSGCNSQRAFCQMLSRVRKIEDSSITIYASQLDYHPLKESNIYTFHEVKESLIALNIIDIKQTIEGSKIVKRLTPYDINFCYNKCEELMMKIQYYYLGYLEYILTKKGHTVSIKMTPKKKDEDGKVIKEKLDDNVKKAKEETNVNKDLNLVKDIDGNEYQFLLNKQKQSKAEQHEKLQIKKYLIKKSLGIDKFNEEILKHYDSPFIIKHIEHLIDIQNVKNYNDNQTKETIKKVEIINDLISKLGFKLFDENTYVSRQDFESKIDSIMKTNEIFINPKLSKVLFRTSKVDIKTNKQFLGFVNSILDNYKLKIKSNQIGVKKADIEKVGKTKDTAYSLVFQEHYDTINELIQYKIDKGYNIIDSKNLRPKPTTEKYKCLIDVDEIKDENEVCDFPDPYGLDFGLC